MSASDDLTMRLRRRVMTDLHLGKVGPGDRLPSIRALAGELDEDHRAVASAYRTLEEEGLVEIRPRSGVVVAPRSRLGEGSVLSSTARWVTGILVEGLSRRIPVPELPELIQQCTRSLELECLCVESVGDVLHALGHEVSKDVGLSTESFLMSEEPTADERRMLTKSLENMDIVVTTVFHASTVSEVAEDRDVSVVEVRINAEWVGNFRRALREGPVTVVVEDPGFEDRLRVALEHHGDLRILEVDGTSASLDDLSADGALFVTPSARQTLEAVEHPALLENVPMLSHATLRRLAEILVRRNVERDLCP